MSSDLNLKGISRNLSRVILDAVHLAISMNHQRQPGLLSYLLEFLPFDTNITIVTRNCMYKSYVHLLCVVSFSPVSLRVLSLVYQSQRVKLDLSVPSIP